ncbi:hypothetical protein OG225_32445 [Nocardia sp. NBC_01377]|uniref:hypothetical protein n=1 Tax=Nocardia sp. NBC_01377 TaxID=2903595 RepID=UPI003244B1C9
MSQSGSITCAASGSRNSIEESRSRPGAHAWASPNSRPHWVQATVDFAHRHPKPCACGGVAFGLIGGIGNITEDLGATAFGLAIAAGCGFLLLRWRRREQADAAAEIAARADIQHNAYLSGDEFGVFGTRDTPNL